MAKVIVGRGTNEDVRAEKAKETSGDIVSAGGEYLLREKGKK